MKTLSRLVMETVRWPGDGSANGRSLSHEGIVSRGTATGQDEIGDGDRWLAGREVGTLYLILHDHD